MFSYEAFIYITISKNEDRVTFYTLKSRGYRFAGRGCSSSKEWKSQRGTELYHRTLASVNAAWRQTKPAHNRAPHIIRNGHAGLGTRVDTAPYLLSRKNVRTGIRSHVTNLAARGFNTRGARRTVKYKFDKSILTHSVRSFSPRGKKIRKEEGASSAER